MSNRMALAEALARHAGKELTKDVGRAILEDLFPDRHVPVELFPRQHVGRFILAGEMLRASVETDALNLAYDTEAGDGDPLAYDYERMLEIQRAGGFVQFVARVAESGELAGVMRLFVGKNERTGKPFCKDNLFFIYQQHRGIELSVALWRYAERCMFGHGVRTVSFLSRKANGADRMAKFLGYTPSAIQFTKSHEGDDYAALSNRHTKGESNESQL